MTDRDLRAQLRAFRVAIENEIAAAGDEPKDRFEQGAVAAYQFALSMLPDAAYDRSTIIVDGPAIGPNGEPGFMVRTAGVPLVQPTKEPPPPETEPKYEIDSYGETHPVIDAVSEALPVSASVPPLDPPCRHCGVPWLHR